MRILFVSESVWRQGPVFDLHMLAEGLVELGHIVYAIDPGEEYDQSDLLWRQHQVARYTNSNVVTLISPCTTQGEYGWPFHSMSHWLRKRCPKVGRIFFKFLLYASNSSKNLARGIYRIGIKPVFPSLLPQLLLLWRGLVNRTGVYALLGVQKPAQKFTKIPGRAGTHASVASVQSDLKAQTITNLLAKQAASKKNSVPVEEDETPNSTAIQASKSQPYSQKLKRIFLWVRKQYNRLVIRYKAMDALLKREKFDVIVLYSVARMGLISAMLARKHGIPVVFRNVDMLHKLWSDKREQYIVRQCENIVYRCVDYFFALTPRYAHYLQNLGANPKKIEVLPFPVDIARFTPAVPQQALREKWGITSKDKVVIFMGALYPFGGLRQLIDCLDTLFNQVPNTKFLIIGDGTIFEELSARIKEAQFDGRIILTGHQPFDLMPAYINLSDVCINVFPINDATNDVFSAKIVQYLACARPTVSSALRGITTMIPENGAGVVFCTEIADIVSETTKLLLDNERHARLASEGIDYVSNHHSFPQILNSFETALEKIVTTSTPFKS